MNFARKHLLAICLPLLLVTSFLLLAALKVTEGGSVKWVVQKGGSLTVNGKTNVNSFKCDITGYSSSDTLLVTRQGNNQSVALKGFISLPVKLFNCHNPIMTGDLRKTLKHKEFPSLIIRFISLQRFPDRGVSSDNVKGVVDISLAGVTKRFEVSYRFSDVNDRTVNMIGERKVLFSDFQLTAPSKLGGMIKTEDELSVVFKLNLVAMK